MNTDKISDIDGYKLIKIDIEESSHSKSVMDTNYIAIVVIFIVLSILCGIICFVFGSGVGGSVAYSVGRKQGKTDVEIWLNGVMCFSFFVHWLKQAFYVIVWFGLFHCFTPSSIFNLSICDLVFLSKSINLDHGYLPQ